MEGKYSGYHSSCFIYIYYIYSTYNTCRTCQPILGGGRGGPATLYPGIQVISGSMRGGQATLYPGVQVISANIGKGERGPSNTLPRHPGNLRYQVAGVRRHEVAVSRCW